MSSSGRSQRRSRVCRSRYSTIVSGAASIVAPCPVIRVRMSYTSKSTFTPSATARSWSYSMTRFLSKNPKVCFAGVAVSPTRNASKYSSTCRHTV